MEGFSLIWRQIQSYQLSLTQFSFSIVCYTETTLSFLNCPLLSCPSKISNSSFSALFWGFSSSKLSNVQLPYSLYPLLQFWWSTPWIVSTISSSQPWSLLYLTHFSVVACSLFRCHEGAHGHFKCKVPPFPGKQVLFFPLDSYYCCYLFIGPQALFLFACNTGLLAALSIPLAALLFLLFTLQSLLSGMSA